MKNIFNLLLSACLCFMGPNVYAQDNKPFTIQGTLFSAPSQFMYLMSNGKRIDSSYTDENGKFLLKSENTEELPYSIFLKLPRPRMIYLALHNENLKIKIDMSGKKIDSLFNDFALEGSPSSYAINYRSYKVSNNYAKKFRNILDSTQIYSIRGDTNSVKTLTSELNKLVL